MPDEPPTVQLVHAEPLADGKGRERIVAILDNGDIAVATRKIGEERAELELCFNLGEAERLAGLCLAGNSHALTTPVLSRLFCAAIIALSRAAFMAGALEAQPAPDRPDAPGHADN